MASGNIYFVPSRAKQASLSSVPDTPTAGTNLKRDAGKTEDNLCDRSQLKDVNFLLVTIWGTDLGEDCSVFNSLVHNPLCRCTYHRGVLL